MGIFVMNIHCSSYFKLQSISLHCNCEKNNFVKMLIILQIIGAFSIVVDSGSHWSPKYWDVVAFLVPGWWRLDSYDLGHGVQTCRPSKTVALQRGWHQHPRQGLCALFCIWKPHLSYIWSFTVFCSLLCHIFDSCIGLDDKDCLKCSVFDLLQLPTLILGGKYLSTLGGILWLCGDSWDPAGCKVWSERRQHPRRLTDAHSVTGEPARLCEVSQHPLGFIDPDWLIGKLPFNLTGL